jgi:hypothetical protein
MKEAEIGGTCSTIGEVRNVYSILVEIQRGTAARRWENVVITDIT